MDDFTYALFHFDKQDFSDYQGKIKNVEVKGDVKLKEGKFGNCAEFDGKGFIEYETDEIFPGGYISMEAWIKVKKYPEDKAYIIFRPARVDKSAKYNPEVDKTKGFSLYIDSKGGLHMAITNTFYGRTTITSSPEGTIPLNKWVHIAGISANFPVSFRRLYLNGKEIVAKPIEWGQGIVVHREEEIEPSPIYIGKGFCGFIDEVRIHRKVFKLWEKENTEWTDPKKEREIEKKPPFFLSSHTPVFYLPLDGNVKPEINRIGEVKITEKGEFIKGGVRGGFFRGSVSLRKEKIISLDEGSIEFWFQPYGVNNYSDRNVSFLNVWPGFNFYIFNGGGPGRPLSIYFRKNEGNLKFISSSIDVYEGKWYHVVITWKGEEIRVYIDGKKTAESSGTSFHTKWNEGYANSVNFKGEWKGNLYAQFDEIYLYDKALTEDEVKNAYWRYRDKRKLVKGIKVYPVEVKVQYMPSFNTVYYRIIPRTEKEIKNVKLEILIQPCVIIWNQREYQKRVWNCLGYWREKRKEPLEWIIHMTNTLLLPVHTFATADLDHELGSKKPFPPDWLRTETIGLQVGNYPLSLYPVSGSKNEIIKKLPEEKRKKIEWGMRMVHEIQRRENKWEKIVREFGYGKKDVKVYNYWGENPAIEVNNEKVKWICVVPV